MCREEREAVDIMIYQVLPSRYGFKPRPHEMAQAVEIVVGQGAKPGPAGCSWDPGLAETPSSARCRSGWTSARRCATPTSSDP